MAIRNIGYRVAIASLVMEENNQLAYLGWAQLESSGFSWAFL